MNKDQIIALGFLTAITAMSVATIVLQVKTSRLIKKNSRSR